MKKKNLTRVSALVAAAALSAGLCSSAQAAFSWVNITQNGNQNVGGQITMAVTGSGNQADFTFQNVGTIASVITLVEFDPGSFGAANFSVLGGNPATTANWISESSGVNFVNSTATLPGGNSLSPVFSTDAAAGATPPPTSNGINNSAAGTEWLTLKFALGNNYTFQDVINSIENGDFRVGMHVQGIGTSAGSDAYVTGAVPEPTTIVAGALLLLPLGLSTLRRRVKQH